MSPLNRKKTRQRLGSICILAAQPVTNRDFRRFGYQELTDLGWEVLFLDCSEITRSSSYLRTVRRWADVDYPDGKVLLVTSRIKLLNILGEVRPDFCFNFLGTTIFERLILFFARKNSTVVNFHLGGYPDENLTIKELLTYQFNDKSIFNFVIWFIEGAFRKCFKNLIKSSESGTINVIGGSKDELLENYIPACSFDYDMFLRYKRKLVNGNSILVVDDGGPTHTDKDFRGVTFSIDWNAYYEKVNKMIIKARKECGAPVLVITHPRADRDIVQSFFPQTEVLQGSSFDQIAQCRGIFSYDSTLITYIVSCRKPFVLYEFALGGWFESHRRVRRKSFAGFARDLKVPIINEQNMNEVDFDSIFSDRDFLYSYDEYIAKYACHPNSSSNGLWESVSIGLLERVRSE